jgi:hypothetical protein
MSRFEIVDALSILFYSISLFISTIGLYIYYQKRKKHYPFMGTLAWNVFVQAMGITSIGLAITDSDHYNSPYIFLIGNMVGAASLITVFFVDLICIEILRIFSILNEQLTKQRISMIKYFIMTSFFILIPWIFLWGYFLGVGNMEIWTFFDRLKLKDVTALIWGGISALCN